MVDRLGGEEELVCDIGVAKATRNERERLELSSVETTEVLARRWVGPMPEAAHAPLTQAAGDDRLSGPRAQALQLLKASPSDTLDVEATGLGFVRLDPGGVARLEFVPRRKGRFVFFCGIEGHREAGMQGFVQMR